MTREEFLEFLAQAGDDDIITLSPGPFEIMVSRHDARAARVLQRLYEEIPDDATLADAEGILMYNVFLAIEKASRETKESETAHKDGASIEATPSAKVQADSRDDAPGMTPTNTPADTSTGALASEHPRSKGWQWYTDDVRAYMYAWWWLVFWCSMPKTRHAPDEDNTDGAATEGDAAAAGGVATPAQEDAHAV